MTRLLILVEGQSEEIFVKQTLAPYLAERGVFVQRPIVLWTKRRSSGGGYRGGVSNWSKIKRSLRPLTHDGNAWTTTLLDFYGLPTDVPGYDREVSGQSPRVSVGEVQKRVAAEINHAKFIPFFALHEFEAWIFCSPDIVAAHYNRPNLASKVARSVHKAGEPELINHGAATHPKAQLRYLVPDFEETSDGPTLLSKIGIPTIRAACPHFAAWLDRLEALA